MKNEMLQQWFEAIKNGDLAKIQELQSTGIDVNSVDQDGNTALHMAINIENVDNRLQILEMLCNFPNIELDKVNSEGKTSLQCTVDSKKYSTYVTLIEAGADASNVKYGDKQLACTMSLNKKLLQAIKDGNIRKTSLLIRAGADASASLDGESIFQTAKMVNNKDVLALIENALSEMEVTKEMVDTYIRQLDIIDPGNGMEARKSNTVGMLLSGLPPINDQHIKAAHKLSAFLYSKRKQYIAREFCEPDTVLAMAAAANQTELVKDLLAAGASVKANSLGVTPLHHAALHGNLEMVKCLINNGADIKAADLNGCTVLHAAAGRGHLDVVKFLLEQGATAITKERNSATTPLHSAARWGKNAKVVELLLKQGADPNATDWNQRTPLHEAAQAKNNKGIISILLENRANQALRDKHGHTAAQIAEHVDSLDYNVGNYNSNGHAFFMFEYAAEMASKEIATAAQPLLGELSDGTTASASSTSSSTPAVVTTTGAGGPAIRTDTTVTTSTTTTPVRPLEPATVPVPTAPPVLSTATSPAPTLLVSQPTRPLVLVPGFRLPEPPEVRPRPVIATETKDKAKLQLNLTSLGVLKEARQKVNDGNPANEQQRQEDFCKAVAQIMSYRVVAEEQKQAENHGQLYHIGKYTAAFTVIITDFIKQGETPVATQQLADKTAMAVRWQIIDAYLEKGVHAGMVKDRVLAGSWSTIAGTGGGLGVGIGVGAVTLAISAAGGAMPIEGAKDAFFTVSADAYQEAWEAIKELFTGSHQRFLDGLAAHNPVLIGIAIALACGMVGFVAGILYGVENAAGKGGAAEMKEIYNQALEQYCSGTMQRGTRRDGK